MKAFSFYRLATIGWSNPLLRDTIPLVAEPITHDCALDLSRLEFADSFGVAYIAACFYNCDTATTNSVVYPPHNPSVNDYLIDVGLYESVGLGGEFRPRRPSSKRVDLVHVTTLSPGFIDHLLNFLETLQPFEPGLRGSMRAALIELIQNFDEHAKSNRGAWIVGQFHRRTKATRAPRITLCVLDLGVGIPGSLRHVKKYRRFGDARLIQLAPEEGVSAGGSSRGKGLSWIRRFVRANGGDLTILSQGAYVKFPSDRRPIARYLDRPFPGTAVFLSLVPTARGLYALEGSTNGTNEN